jgi:hypothetical protein
MIVVLLLLFVKQRTPIHLSIPLPTEAELAILNILWSIGPATVREVHDALSGKQIGYTTVLILDWSPEQISKWLKVHYPSNESMLYITFAIERKACII